MNKADTEELIDPFKMTGQNVIETCKEKLTQRFKAINENEADFWGEPPAKFREQIKLT